MRRPTFSVILPTYNRCEVVERTLRQLLAQDYPSDRFEIIVVDNSTDGTPAMVEALAQESAAAGGPRVHLLWLPERLPAVKRNRGLAVAVGDYAYFVNDDVWFASDAVSHHATTHAAWGEPIAVLGSCRQSTEMSWTPFTEFYQPFPYSHMTHLVDKPVPYQYFWSMNLSMPREVMLERNLLFHEDWSHIGHEDVELGWRWAQSGLKAVYNPRATGDHYHPHTVASGCRLQESIGRGLRDLEVLVDDENLLTRYGVLARNAPPRALVRGLLREALFNRWTALPVAHMLDRQQRSSRLARWTYWKVMLYYTNYGYRTEPRRPRQSRQRRPGAAVGRDNS